MSDEEICIVLGICEETKALRQVDLLAVLMARAYGGDTVEDARVRILAVVKEHKHKHEHRHGHRDDPR